ncbi:TPA: fimbrial protein [Providencia rettgeri]
MLTIKKTNIIISTLFLLISNTINAKDTETINFSIMGSVISKPQCEISDNKTIEINFGDSIGINKISSGEYEQKIPYKIKCDGESDELQLTIKISGNAVNFDPDNATIRTNEQENLGVKIYHDGKPFELDKSIPINSSNLPELYAVLIKNDDGELIEGEFNAYATIEAEYQ